MSVTFVQAQTLVHYTKVTVNRGKLCQCVYGNIWEITLLRKLLRVDCIVFHSFLCFLFSAQQYFFSDDVIRFISDTLVSQDITDVLCIGTPSLHESLLSRTETKAMKSFLLDWDVRLVCLQFSISQNSSARINLHATITSLVLKQ